MPTTDWTNRDDVTIQLPARWEICHRCEGNGRRDPDTFSQGWTQSEWAEEDYEFKERYMAGFYDVSCNECEGSGKVLVVDEERCDKDDLKAYRDYQEAIYQHERICAAERRMGA